MKRVISTIVFLYLVISIGAVQPYYSLGQLDKSIKEVTAQLTKLLLANNLDVLGIHHPNNNENLCVITFTCDEVTSIATSVKDKGAFGAVLKIGLIGKGESTEVTMLNPFYIKQAYLSKNTNKYETKKMTARAESKVMLALNPLVKKMTKYGRDIPKEDLWSYHFLPLMARYEDVVELNEFDTYLEAVTIIKANLLKQIEECELVYELGFSDKEISLFGVAFHGKNNPDEQMLKLMGHRCISSLPIEILVQGNKAFILNGNYRIPLYKSDLNRSKFFKVFKTTSDIKSRLKKVAKPKR